MMKKDTCKCGECFQKLENPDLKLAMQTFNTSFVNLSKEAQDIKLFTLLRDMRREQLQVNHDRPTDNERVVNQLGPNLVFKNAPRLHCRSTFHK